jgi:hypothetical protein
MLFFVGPQLPIHPSGDSSLTAGPHLEPLRSRLISSRRCSISFAAWFNTRQSISDGLSHNFPLSSLLDILSDHFAQ